MGGDEFVVILPNLPDEGVKLKAELVNRRFERPFILDKGTATITASIGIAKYTPEASTPEELIASADQAMYRAKANKPDRRTRFTFDMRQMSRSPRQPGGDVSSSTWLKR
jgi:diguanylate cyclase (GGDEF)-like protein